MAYIAHLVCGFGGKWIAPRINLFILIIASEIIDIIWLIFQNTGIENTKGMPWSHGLFMSLVWSILVIIIIFFIFKNFKSAISVGIIVFSHWIIDFITHPMGALVMGKPTDPDLFLFFFDSPLVGLGLYNHSATIAYIFEILILSIGILLYILYKRK